MTADNSQPRYWDVHYVRGNIPWDLGRPTPVFRRLLHQEVLAPGSMVVLGAGRGYDARLFARHGFTVTAVDFAPAAAAAMRSLAEEAAPVRIVEADIFALPAALDNQFDYVLEYTCYCAIPPRRRPDYADVVSRLLRPGGRYVALAFPLSPRQGGPPYAVSAAELISMLGRRGLRLTHRERPPDSVPARHGREELLILQL